MNRDMVRDAALNILRPMVADLEREIREDKKLELDSALQPHIDAKLSIDYSDPERNNIRITVDVTISPEAWDMMVPEIMERMRKAVRE